MAYGNEVTVSLGSHESVLETIKAIAQINIGRFHYLLKGEYEDVVVFERHTDVIDLLEFARKAGYEYEVTLAATVDEHTRSVSADLHRLVSECTPVCPHMVFVSMLWQEIIRTELEVTGHTPFTPPELRGKYVELLAHAGVTTQAKEVSELVARVTRIMQDHDVIGPLRLLPGPHMVPWSDGGIARLVAHSSAGVTMQVLYSTGKTAEYKTTYYLWKDDGKQYFARIQQSGKHRDYDVFIDKYGNVDQSVYTPDYIAQWFAPPPPRRWASRRYDSDSD